MENRNGSSTPRNYHHQQRDDGMLSCWGRFKLKYLYFPWRRWPTLGGSSSTGPNPPPIGITATGCGNFLGALWGSGSQYRRRSPTAGGGGSSGFRYDPIEYAQNFDDGNWNDDNNENGFNRGFSSRLAPSPSSSPSSTRPLHDK